MLIAQIASAPPFSAASAITPMSGTLGVNFATTGTLTAAFTEETIFSTKAGSWPIAIPSPLA